MTSNERLEREIEKLVRAHLAACHRSATAAVSRAVAAAMSGSAPIIERARPPRRVPRPRRSPEELARLDEQLYAAMCERPGETMAVLAGHLGMSSRSLQVSVQRLKRAERVRSVGLRPYTRYFPMSMEGSESQTTQDAVERDS